jgi:transcriptional regulator
MYVPANFRAPSVSDMESIISKHPFGLLISGVHHATHIPLELTERNGIKHLEGHLSAANPHAEILDNTDGLAVFTGPHCYVSSSWYQKVNVPTWNYISVHVTGTTRILNSRESLELISEQMKRYESGNENGTKLSDLPGPFLDAHLKGIVCFRMEIKKMESAFKLSQNRNDSDYANIISMLETTGDPGSVEIAQWMKKLRQ